jgi:hypothetical protein
LRLGLGPSGLDELQILDGLALKAASVIDAALEAGLGAGTLVECLANGGVRVAATRPEVGFANSTSGRKTLPDGRGWIRSKGFAAAVSPNFRFLKVVYSWRDARRTFYRVMYRLLRFLRTLYSP